MKVSFDVERAGCESCGTLISTALSRIATVATVDIDQDTDIARVALSGAVSQDAVESALEEASAGAGHEYRVRRGSWRALG